MFGIEQAWAAGNEDAVVTGLIAGGITTVLLLIVAF